MLDEQKVKLMTELALYEQNEGKEDFKINEYYRNDYVGFHVICSVIWITLGYAGAVGLLMIAMLDYLAESLSKNMILTCGMGIVGGYLAVLIIYGFISRYVFLKKHKEARDRMKGYNNNLIELLEMYEKEKR